MSFEDTQNSSSPGTEAADGSTSSKFDSVSIEDISLPCFDEKRHSAQRSSRKCERTESSSGMLQPVPGAQLQMALSSDTKKCYDCHCVLPIERFSRHITNGVEYRNGRCSSCRARRHAGTPKQRAKFDFVEKAKAVPCCVCGRTFPPECMDFDHRDPADKKHNIAAIVYWVSMEKLAAEIAKCDVICACCHRTRSLNDKRIQHGRKFKFLAEVPAATPEVRAA